MYQMNLTKLRQNLFRVVDEVIETGVPQRIERKGKVLKLVLDTKYDKLKNLKPHHGIVGDPDELVNLKAWTWEPDKSLNP